MTHLMWGRFVQVSQKERRPESNPFEFFFLIKVANRGPNGCRYPS